MAIGIVLCLRPGNRDQTTYRTHNRSHQGLGIKVRQDERDGGRLGGSSAEDGGKREEGLDVHFGGVCMYSMKNEWWCMD